MSGNLIVTSRARPAVRLTAGVVLVLLLAGTAAGQLPAQNVPSTLAVILEDIGGPVAPGSVRNLSVVVVWTAGLGGVTTGPTRVTLTTPEVPPWATFVMDPDTFDIAYNPAEEDDPTRAPQKRVESVGVLSVFPSAPAFRRGNLTIVAESQPNGNIQGSRGQTQVFVIPGFNGTLDIDAPDAVTVRGGLARDVEFSVTNLGNAEALVTFTLPSKPELALTTIPDPVMIAPNETVTRAIGLRASWVEGGSGLLTIEATPSLEGRRDVEVEPTRHEVLVTSIAAIPGASASLLALAVGALAVALRRAR